MTSDRGRAGGVIGRMGHSENLLAAVPSCTSRAASEQADLLLDGIIVALQEFDTETLRAITDYRDAINPNCWMPKLIREYLSVWRQG